MRVKKLLSLTLILLVFSVFMVSCSSNSSSGEENESGTINAIFPSGDGTDKAIKKITEEFEEENPDIEVNLEFVEYGSLKQKILTTAKTGEYDVTMVDLPWLAQFANGDILQEIPDGLSEEDESDIFDSILEGVKYNDKMYAMPWKNDTKFLYYNKDILEDAGFDSPPETWDEMNKQAKKIKDDDIKKHPISWSWTQDEALMADYSLLISGFGGDLLIDGEPNFESNEVEKATTFMVNSLKDGTSNPNSTEFLEQDVLDNFINEESAFAINWGFMYHEVKDSDISDKLGVTVVPGSEDVETSSVYGGEGLGITSGSDNPDSSMEYIKFITSKEIQEENVDVTLPIWRSLYSDDAVLDQGTELVEAAEKQFDNMVSRPKTPAYGEFSDSTQIKLQDILTGNKDVKTGLSELQQETEEVLNEE